MSRMGSIRNNLRSKNSSSYSIPTNSTMYSTVPPTYNMTIGSNNSTKIYTTTDVSKFGKARLFGFKINIPIESLNLSDQAEVTKTKMMMKNALQGPMHSQNPFGAAGITDVDILIVKKTRKRRSTGKLSKLKGSKNEKLNMTLKNFDRSRSCQCQR